ncbi:MAG: polysaccharide biosynthesis tyrosine autokinase [Anaerolineae bacterium]
MTLRQYFTVVWKWLWLIVLAGAVAGGSAYVSSQSMPRIYQSTTTIMVGQKVIQSPNVTSQDIFISQQLAQTYVQMATRQPILQATIEALGLKEDWMALRERVNASLVQGTALVQISVLDTSPEWAVAIANEIARQMILQSPTAPEDAQRNKHRAFVERQIADLQAKIEAAQQQVADLEKQLGEAFSARQIQDLQGQINVLQNQISTWHGNYAQLLNFIEGGAPNYLTVIEPAQLPTEPVSPRTAMNVMLATSIGILLALGAAFLLEYLDDTIKLPDDLMAATGLTPLASITRMRGEGYENKLVTARHPRSSIAEAYRTLRTNIQFSTLDKPARTLLVTSPGSLEGKSVTSANLAVSMAQAGLKTVLVDADLRRPAQHKIFGLPNQQGLTNALLQPGEPSPDGHLQATQIENLRILTSGPIPPNPSELLGSARMQALLQKLKEENDVVIFDSPPVLVVTDASVLATRVDGVVMVTDSGHTRRDMVVRAQDALRKVGANLLGGVVNRLSARSGGYYQYYYYYYYYSADGDGEPKRKRKKRHANHSEPGGLLRGWFGKPHSSDESESSQDAQ